MRKLASLLCSCGLALASSSCDRQADDAGPAAPSDYQKQLQTQLITAQPGDVILIPAGTHEINRGLSLAVGSAEAWVHSINELVAPVRGCYIR